MKQRVEMAIIGVSKFTKKMFSPPMLSPEVYTKQAEMICRMDGRDITEIALEGGYKGREFTGRVRDVRHYALTNRPSIGYGGCLEMSAAIKFSKGREALHMHVHITCPTNNTVISMPSAILRHGIGDYESEPGSKSLTAHDLLAEQEYVTVNDVLMPQFLASISPTHTMLINEGISVPNQLKTTGVDESAPESLTKQDCANSTAMMLACLRQGCDEKATVIATKVEAERVYNEALKNDYCRKTRQELVYFWNSANSTKDKFKIPEDQGTTISVVKN